MTAPRIQCVDLFCGVGGLTHGLARAGIEVVAGIDLDRTCRFPYEANNRARFIHADVKDLKGDDVAALFDGRSLRLLAGCAPCQPFSTYSRSSRLERPDHNWALVGEFARLAREVRPDLISMENVPQLADHPVFGEFVAALDGYSVSWRVEDCVRHGIPQTRKRLVLVASRLGPVGVAPFDAGPHPVTVREAIAHLPVLQAGQADPEDVLHVACRLSEINLRRIRASRPGGTWRDWDPSLRARCHREKSGETYPSVYGRMAWDEPSPTITTQCFGYGNGRFGHPEQDRAISLREAAILQTFPRDYRFIPPGERARFSVHGRLIGNAVPVRIAEAIGRALVAHVRTHAAESGRTRDAA
ncbi:DNA cytosine methyltransferase [Salinarimonas soli]|uniref:DNA (cytosine-5-)-methyltransferase n=1 Tax=Salinarimonas soli TaxID=1638099 RepID=A0A5B2V9R0_9HYPH|nr:DNA cytosine methyltransferase [Salinarimonas soli]KAA2235586.1 DNA cytosine methyltransferase [Salinarimonas soli]